MSYHVRAGDRIFSDWGCPCGENFSTNEKADVETVSCPSCGKAFDMGPPKAKLKRVRQEHELEEVKRQLGGYASGVAIPATRLPAWEALVRRRKELEAALQKEAT